MNTIFNKIAEYTKINFVVNWASGTLLVAAITSSIYFKIQNDSLREKQIKQDAKIASQATEIETLKETQDFLKITFESYKGTVEAFREYPPILVEEKINGLKREIDRYHNNNNSNNSVPTEYESNTPTNPN